MKILAHRGLWETTISKNTEQSFRKAWELGFGIETDIRDYNGMLVISHDVANSCSLKFEDFLELYSLFGKSSEIAINIKSDGLAIELDRVLKKYNVCNYFVFDNSVPDTLDCLNRGMISFCRLSEYEKSSGLVDIAHGIWLDSFHSDWYDENIIFDNLKKLKKVALVSPELHERDYSFMWSLIKAKNLQTFTDLYLCTDFPQRALKYFYDKD